jgi:hypothetical protein
MLTSNERIINSQSRFVRISSEDKVIGTNSQFNVNLESAGGAIDNVKGFIVHSIECPNVFNNVTSFNNNLIISFPGPSTETEININITEGYYLIDDLINIINARVALEIANNGDTYTFVLSKVGIFPNEKIQFDATGLSAGACALFTSDTTILPSLGVESTPNAIAPNVPFTIIDSVPAFAQNIPNLIGETAVYVHSRTLCPLNLSEGTGTFSVVDKLNLNEPFGSTCYSNFNNDITHQKSYFPFESKKTLRKVDITLRNRTGQILDLPSNFNFTMMIKIFHT